ncbi:MAG: fumarate hydratase, partial [Acidobacteriota bacterium]|nr:fumarate hydratase [Acidobacteriota bacterium]
MKKVSLSQVKEKVKQAVQEANFIIDKDLKNLVQSCYPTEESPAGQEVLKQILQNADIAAQEKLAMCQDTGLAVFFVELGEQVQLEYDGFKSLHDAISQGTVEGYGEGYLRKSVCDPLSRKNTGNNTPVFIHWDVVPGDAFKMTFMAKGGGAENMSALKMMPPSAGAKGIEDFVVETVSKAGPNPCPPTVVGVGIGGNFDTSALLAKKA